MAAARNKISNDAERKIIIDEMCVEQTTSTVQYCKKIVAAMKQSENDFDPDHTELIKVSGLYEALLNFKGEYEKLLYVFIDYYRDMYCHISHFVRKENYEAAELIKKAADAEAGFIVGFVVHNYDGLRNDVTQIKKRINDYYLM